MHIYPFIYLSKYYQNKVTIEMSFISLRATNWSKDICQNGYVLKIKVAKFSIVMSKGSLIYSPRIL